MQQYYENIILSESSSAKYLEMLTS